MEVQIREIPYKAIGAELPDLIGGHVDPAFLSPVVIRDHVRSGKRRGLAVASRERLGPRLPCGVGGMPGLRRRYAVVAVAAGGAGFAKVIEQVNIQ